MPMVTELHLKAASPTLGNNFSNHVTPTPPKSTAAAQWSHCLLRGCDNLLGSRSSAHLSVSPQRVPEPPKVGFKAPEKRCAQAGPIQLFVSRAFHSLPLAMASPQSLYPGILAVVRTLLSSISY